MFGRIAAALILLVSAVSCAEARFPRGAPAVPQIIYNIVTDGGATCNGDVQVVTRLVTMSNGSPVMTVDSSTFAPGDVGKQIALANFGPGGNTSLYATIITYTSDTQVTLSANAQFSRTNFSVQFGFGSDDADNFKTFNTWAVANQGNNQVVLDIPSGASCWFGSSQFYAATNLSNAFTAGINNLIVRGGTSSTISTLGGAGLFLGVRGVCQAGLSAVGGCTARIDSVTAGSSTVTLTAASYAAGYLSRFSVGKMIMLAGLDVQGGFQVGYGFPPNETYFEWRRVTHIDSGTGVITLDSPISQDYLSTWPNYNTGTSGEADQAGQATIYAMHDTWDKTVEYQNLTITQSGQMSVGARYATFRNVFFTGAGGNCGVFPSQNQTFTAVNTNWDNCIIEVDKLVNLVSLDSVTIRQIDWQSNSIDRLVMTNSTVQTMFGGARDSQVTDTSFTTLLRPGSYNYGSSSKFVCTRCAVTSFEPTGGISSPINSSVLTMSGGVITWPVSYANVAAQNWSSPIGVPAFFTSGSYNLGTFLVTGISGGIWPAPDNQSTTTNVTISSGSPNLGVSGSIFSSGDVGKVIIVNGAGNSGFPLRAVITSFTDAQNVVLAANAGTSLVASSQTVQWGTSNVSVQTSLVGGFPPTTNFGGGTVGIRTRGAPQFTCDACTGDVILVGMNIQNGAIPLAPMGTFVKRDFAPTANFKNASIPTLGKFVSLTIDVTQAYTGTGTAIVNPTAEFNNYNLVKQDDWTTFLFWPTINLKQTGTRVITTSGVTCNGVPGGCSGDTIPSTPPVSAWVSSAYGVSQPSTLSGGGTLPIYSITSVTDQTP